MNIRPAIRELADKRISELKKGGSEVILLEAAVLIEAEWKDLVDEIWVVMSKEETQKQRLMKRNNLSEEDALMVSLFFRDFIHLYLNWKKRIRAQTQDKEKHAHLVLENEGTIEELREKVLKAFKKPN